MSTKEEYESRCGEHALLNNVLDARIRNQQEKVDCKARALPSSLNDQRLVAQLGINKRSRRFQVWGLADKIDPEPVMELEFDGERWRIATVNERFVYGQVFRHDLLATYAGKL